jgi:AcrR family transcriptional regulator
MSPRPYRLGQRQAAAAQTRARIVSAARELLTAPEGLSGFTVEAVARQAGVARMTVYYQFGSKLGLLEALFDTLASHRGASQLVAAIGAPDPLAGLARFITLIGGFWAADRLLVYRLQGLAALDPDFGRVWSVREGLRREGLAALARRLSDAYGWPSSAALSKAVDVLFALVSFETFNALAGPDRSLDEVAPLVLHLATAGLRI